MGDDPDALISIATSLSSSSTAEARAAASHRAEAAAARVSATFADRVQSESSKERAEAALELARWVENAFGEEAAALGQEMRTTGAVSFVLRLLFEAERTLLCVGLMLVTNLVCLEFDPNGAVETSKCVYKADIFQKLKDLCLSDDSVVVGHACACLQNLCREPTFAKLVLRFEMEAELNRLVKESDDEYVQQCAAGALSNTVEAIQREALKSSLSRVDQAVAGTGEEQQRRKSLGAMSLFRHAFGEKPPTEIELEDEVHEALARAEATRLREHAERDEAAGFIQSVVRSRRATRALRMLLRLAAVTKIVVRWTRRKRNRRLRRAVLVIQAHARAYMCSSRDICGYSTTLRMIYGLRGMHLLAVVRQVYTRYPGLQPADVTLPGLPGAVRRKWLQRFTTPFRAFRWTNALGRMRSRPVSYAPAPKMPRQRIKAVGLLRSPAAAVVERCASSGAPVAPGRMSSPTEGEMALTPDVRIRPPASVSAAGGGAEKSEAGQPEQETALRGSSDG